MVFDSFKNKEDEIHQLRLNKEKVLKEQENYNKINAAVSGFKFKPKVSKEITILTDAETEQINKVQNASEILHRVMKSSDVPNAIKFLEKEGLLDEFYNYSDVFLERFKGTKKIPLHLFREFWLRFKNNETNIILKDLKVDNNSHLNQVPEGNLISFENLPQTDKRQTEIQRRDNLESKSLPELKEIAKNQHINLGRSKTTQAIINAIIKHEINNHYLHGTGFIHKNKKVRLGYTNSADGYAKLGNKYIRKENLDKNEISIRYPNGTYLHKHKHVSNDLINLIKDMIYADHFDQHRYDSLDFKSKKIFNDVLNTTKLKYDNKYNLHHFENPFDQLKAEYEKLKGELESGNDNPAIIKKLKSVILELYQNKLISDAEFKRVLETLF